MADKNMIVKIGPFYDATPALEDRPNMRVVPRFTNHLGDAYLHRKYDTWRTRCDQLHRMSVVDLMKSRVRIWDDFPAISFEDCLVQDVIRRDISFSGRSFESEVQEILQRMSGRIKLSDLSKPEKAFDRMREELMHQIGSKPFCTTCGILVPEAGVVCKRKTLVKCLHCEASPIHA